METRGIPLKYVLYPFVVLCAFIRVFYFCFTVPLLCFFALTFGFAVSNFVIRPALVAQPRFGPDTEDDHEYLDSVYLRD